MCDRHDECFPGHECNDCVSFQESCKRKRHGLFLLITFNALFWGGFLHLVVR